MDWNEYIGNAEDGLRQIVKIDFPNLHAQLWVASQGSPRYYLKRALEIKAAAHILMIKAEISLAAVSAMRASETRGEIENFLKEVSK